MSPEHDDVGARLVAACDRRLQQSRLHDVVGVEACMLRGALVAHRDGCPAGDVVSACGGGTGALRIAVG